MRCGLITGSALRKERRKYFIRVRAVMRTTPASKVWAPCFCKEGR